MQNIRLASLHIAIALSLTTTTTTTTARAQAISPVGVQRAAAYVRDTLPRPGNVDDERSGDLDVISRIGLGVVGTAGGAVAGIMIGVSATQGCHGEDCGLAAGVLGAAVGAILGSAIVAGAPEIGSKCDAFLRIGEGVAAAVVGGILGGVIGSAGGGGGMPLGFVVGTSIGGGVGASICR